MERFTEQSYRDCLELAACDRQERYVAPGWFYLAPLVLVPVAMGVLDGLLGVGFLLGLLWGRLGAWLRSKRS